MADDVILAEAEDLDEPPARRGRKPRKHKRRGRRLFWLLLICLVLWAGGLAYFSFTLPKQVADETAQTDVIVVLTGGADRLQTGFDLLTAKRAGQLFISGVFKGVDVANLISLTNKKPDEVKCCVTLGYAAEHTAGNAQETAEWMVRNNFASARLVTANYHMRRSLLEFQLAAPELRIVPHPVFPESVKSNHWYSHPDTLKLFALEYSKYLVAWGRFGFHMSYAWVQAKIDASGAAG